MTFEMDCCEWIGFSPARIDLKSRLTENSLTILQQSNWSDQLKEAFQ